MAACNWSNAPGAQALSYLRECLDGRAHTNALPCTPACFGAWVSNVYTDVYMDATPAQQAQAVLEHAKWYTALDAYAHSRPAATLDAQEYVGRTIYFLCTANESAVSTAWLFASKVLRGDVGRSAHLTRYALQIVDKILSHAGLRQGVISINDIDETIIAIGNVTTLYVTDEDKDHDGRPDGLTLANHTLAEAIYLKWKHLLEKPCEVASAKCFPTMTTPASTPTAPSPYKPGKITIQHWGRGSFAAAAAKPVAVVALCVVAGLAGYAVYARQRG